MITTRGLRIFRKRKRRKNFAVILYLDGVYPIFLNEIKPLYYEKFHGKMRFVKSIITAKDYVTQIFEEFHSNDMESPEFNFNIITNDRSNELEQDILERLDHLERLGNRQCFLGVDCNDTKMQIVDLRKELIVIRELTGKNNA